MALWPSSYVYSDLAIFRGIFNHILAIFALKTRNIIEKEDISMKDDLIIERLNYFKGGLSLIEKERKQLIKKFLRFQFTLKNIKRYIQVKKDYKMVKYNIDFYERVLND